LKETPVKPHGKNTRHRSTGGETNTVETLPWKPGCTDKQPESSGFLYGILYNMEEI
jgi:hypothetical protein